jgi:hypothetical protein
MNNAQLDKLIEAIDRLTHEVTQHSRDPEAMLLKRIQELKEEEDER